MAGPRTLAAMTPEQINEKVENLNPAWAKDYIRRLEGQLTEAQGYTRQLEDLTRTLNTQLTETQGELRDARGELSALEELTGPIEQGSLARTAGTTSAAAAPEIEEEWDPAAHGQPAASAPAGNGWIPAGQQGDATSAAWLSGIEPPVEGQYAPVQVVNGAANMDPVADLDPRFEIRFADFYQVRYGDHETTGGMRVLVIEGDGPIRIDPVSPTTVLVTRGGSGG